MKIYYVRHQAAGVLYEHPFAAPPSPAEVAPLLAKCKAAHGEDHPKTGKYWAKVVCVENGMMETVCCAHGGAEKAEAVDVKASGGCPIRAAGLKRWPDAPEGGGNVSLKVTVSGVGHVQ